MSAPDPLLLLAGQIAVSFLVFGLGAAHLHAPLRLLRPERALVPLLWVHAFRFIPLGLLAPGQSGPGVALEVASPIAVGDLVSALCALAALALLHRRAPVARTAVWIFWLVSLADIVVALSLGLGHQLYREPLGVSWYVLSVYVPLVCVSQAMILVTLRRRDGPSLRELPQGLAQLRGALDDRAKGA